MAPSRITSLLAVIVSLLPLAPLSAAEPQSNIPFTFSILAPEITKPNWFQYTGVGLNLMSEPTLNKKGALVYQSNEWFTMGKGNYFLDVQQPSFTNKHVLSANAGTIEVESVPNTQGRVTGDDYKLQIRYNLTYPIQTAHGMAYVVLTINAPLPEVPEGKGLKVSFWGRQQITSASVERLAVEGAIATFGGDIFSEVFARPFLSFRPPEMIRTLTEYTVQTGLNEIIISPKRIPEVMDKLSKLSKYHASDTAEANANRAGFYLEPNWKRIVTPKQYLISNIDRESGTCSIELVLRLPFQQGEQGRKTWDTVSGVIEISGLQWWID